MGSGPIVQSSAALSRSFLLPEMAEKLPDAGFIAERPFDIISMVMKPVRHECGQTEDRVSLCKRILP